MLVSEARDSRSDQKWVFRLIANETTERAVLLRTGLKAESPGFAGVPELGPAPRTPALISKARVLPN